MENSDIGVEIQLKRIEKGFTKSRLAELCNVTLTYITMVERGVHNPTKDMRENILSMLQ